jgi:hypothetical protein
MQSNYVSMRTSYSYNYVSQPLTTKYGVTEWNPSGIALTTILVYSEYEYLVLLDIFKNGIR